MSSILFLRHGEELCLQDDIMWGLDLPVQCTHDTLALCAVFPIYKTHSVEFQMVGQSTGNVNGEQGICTCRKSFNLNELKVQKMTIQNPQKG